MRCSIKVAYRDGLSRVERREPSYNSSDDRALQALTMDILDSWERFSHKRTEESAHEVTTRSMRSVNRAFRFSSWAYIRLSSRCFLAKNTGLYKIAFDITVDDPNHAGDDVVNAAKREAVFLAEIIIARREIAFKEVRSCITFDERNEFFAAALAGGIREAAEIAAAEKIAAEKMADDGKKKSA